MKRLAEIPWPELATLRRKALAHDDYLSAILAVERRSAQIEVQLAKHGGDAAYLRGYASAITDLGQAVADAVTRRWDEGSYPVGATAGPSDVRD